MTIRGADLSEGLPAAPVNAGGSLAGNDSMDASSISCCTCSGDFSSWMAVGASLTGLHWWDIAKPLMKELFN